MRVKVVFPPSLCLPNQIYFSLPLLAGALRRAGHHVACVDLNLAAADLLLDERRAAHYLGLAGAWLESCRARGESPEIGLEAMAPRVADGERCKRILRDPDRFYDQPSFKHAFWTIVDALAFFYQLDPVISPHRDTFTRDMIENQESDHWTPSLDLYDAGLLDDVLRGDPDVVGLSVAFPEQAVESVRLARRIRERRPDVHICMGGPLITSFADKWLEDDGWLLRYCDSIVVGDGTDAVVQLCEALEGRLPMEGVTNLVYRDGAGHVTHNTLTPHLEAMDDLPLPDFRDAQMERYFLPRPIYPVMLSRGCYWGRCTFCSAGWRDNYRMASREKIRADVVDLARTYGARYLQLQDSSVPPKGARILSEVIAEEGLDLSWVGGMKFESSFMDPGYCDTLGKGGCRSLLMGFESANQQVLDLMDKGFRLDQVPTMLRNLRNAGVSAELLWFIGFPGEHAPDVLATAEYLYDNRHLFGLTAFVGDYLLHPDTEVFERPGDFGVTITGQTNGACHYVVKDGIQQTDLQVLKRLLASNNNRTLVCNGSHIAHLAERPLDLSGLERPPTVPADVRQFVTGA